MHHPNSLLYCRDDLQTFPLETLDNMLSSDSSSFLQYIGIPPYFGLRIDPWAKLYQTSITDQLYFNNLLYLIIWKGDPGVNICIFQQDQKVYSVDDTPNSKSPIGFVNSSIHQCVLFVCLLNKLLEVEPDKRREVFFQIKSEMEQIDKEAFANDDYWWAVAMYDLEPLD